jgi:hypothetical protein
VDPAAGPDPGDPAAARPPVLVCRACGAVVARPEDAIAVREAHAHHVFNPAGVVFHIGCFAQARGVRVAGPYTTAFTWFPGYAWAPTACGTCARHLGWAYRADAGATPRRFDALILERIGPGGGGRA